MPDCLPISKVAIQDAQEDARLSQATWQRCLIEMIDWRYLFGPVSRRSDRVAGPKKLSKERIGVQFGGAFYGRSHLASVSLRFKNNIPLKKILFVYDFERRERSFLIFWFVRLNDEWWQMTLGIVLKGLAYLDAAFRPTLFWFFIGQNLQVFRFFLISLAIGNSHWV